MNNDTSEQFSIHVQQTDIDRCME